METVVGGGSQRWVERMILSRGSDPEVRVHTLTKDDEFLVVACDGLWDVIPSKRVVELARLNLTKTNNPLECAKSLVRSPFFVAKASNFLTQDARCNC